MQNALTDVEWLGLFEGLIPSGGFHSPDEMEAAFRRLSADATARGASWEEEKDMMVSRLLPTLVVMALTHDIPKAQVDAILEFCERYYGFAPNIDGRR